MGFLACLFNSHVCKNPYGLYTGTFKKIKKAGAATPANSFTLKFFNYGKQNYNKTPRFAKTH
jgi:hypothetical protein